MVHGDMVDHVRHVMEVFSALGSIRMNNPFALYIDLKESFENGEKYFECINLALWKSGLNFKWSLYARYIENGALLVHNIDLTAISEAVRKTRLIFGIGRGFINYAWTSEADFTPISDKGLELFVSIFSKDDWLGENL